MSLRRHGIRKADVILASALLLAAVAIGAAFALMPGAQTAVVQVGGETALALALPVGHELYEIEGNGFHLTVETDGSRVRVARADCPDQTCVRSGWIERAGSAVVCVPAGVIVRLEGPTRGEVDAVLR